MKHFDLLTALASGVQKFRKRNTETVAVSPWRRRVRVALHMAAWEWPANSAAIERRQTQQTPRGPANGMCYVRNIRAQKWKCIWGRSRQFGI